MNSVYDIVNRLESTSGKNDKLTFLKLFRDIADIKQFFYLALEPTILFFMKKIPSYDPDGLVLNSLNDAMYELVNVIASREKTGDAARAHVSYLLTSLSANDAAMLERIILKDPRVGMSVKPINKVWPKLCTEKLYDRCAAFNEKNLDRIDYKALCQLKADGQFFNTIRRATGQATFLSRNMKAMSFRGYLEAEFAAMTIPGNIDVVIHGEGLVLNEARTEFLPRKTGNGIINKAMKGTISEDEASRVHVVVWDIMPLADWKNKKCIWPYEMRLHTLEDALPKDMPKLKIIPTRMVNSLNEAYDFFDKMLANGKEGCILKNLKGIWKNSSSGNPDCVKMKKKDPADLKCTGTYPHKKDYVMRGKVKVDTSNWIGGLNLESADGKIVVNSGSGLNDELRAKPPEYFIDYIWEVEYNEIVDAENRTDGTLSMFLPIIKERRDPGDKDEADSYELILERSKANKNRAK
jgi:ATP-dependent DNA ligase